jgi:hypothetical protein
LLCLSRETASLALTKIEKIETFSESSMIECNLSLSSVEISSATVCCNLTNFSLTSAVAIFGNSSSNYIAIRDSTVAVSLSSLSVQSGGSAISVSNSSATFQFSGKVHIRTSSLAPSIACSLGSNLSFAAADSAANLALSPGNGTAIGSGPDGTCGDIAFHNGTYEIAGSGGIGSASAPGASLVHGLVFYGGTFTIDARDSPGIGAGNPASNSSSVIQNIVIYDGNFTITGTTGIGSGNSSGPNANSSVGSINIYNGSFFVNGSAAAAIGSGSARLGNSTVTRIYISGGTFGGVTSNGAVIGAGNAAQSGVSSVGEIEIEGGYFNLTSLNGSAIGAGFADDSCASVDSIRIGNGSFLLNALGGAGIGGGYGHYAQKSDIGSITIQDGRYSIVGGSGRESTPAMHSFAPRRSGRSRFPGASLKLPARMARELERGRRRWERRSLPI